MDFIARYAFTFLLFFFFSEEARNLANAVSIGINYGQIANNLPPPTTVVPLLKSIGIKKVKLYDADCHVLKAFANTGVEFYVSLGNEYITQMRDPAKAMDWVKENVQCYLPATKITGIIIGNEVLTSNDTSLYESLSPVMINVYNALVSLGLDKQITVTTTHSLAVLADSYPPSSARFRPDLVKYILPVLNLNAKLGTPFLINVYPYFAYKANPKHVSLNFVLFESDEGVLDPKSNLHYDNMFFAQIDAVNCALGKVGYQNMLVRVSETGWPSKGDGDEYGATPEYAMKYNKNLMKLMKQKKGTPMRPDCELDVYVFALFNENLKPGPTSERNYGLFKPDGSPVYDLGLSNKNDNNVSSGSNFGTNVFNPPQENNTSTDFFSISSATEIQGSAGISLAGLCALFIPLWIL